MAYQKQGIAEAFLVPIEGHTRETYILFAHLVRFKWIANILVILLAVKINANNAFLNLPSKTNTK